MIKRLFNGQINSINMAALLVALSSLVSRLLGIFRDRILAGEFGAGDTLDIYYAAFRLPDLIFNLLVLGALSAGFIPVFIKLIKKSKDAEDLAQADLTKSWQLASNVLNILALSLLILAALGIFFAPWITKLITPGFSAEKMKLTVGLSQIMFLSPIFLGISSVFGGILQSFKRFFVYSLSPIFYNIGIIIGALYLVPSWGIYGLAWGVVIGAVAHLLVQLPTVFSLGYKYHWLINFADSSLRQLGVMMIPRTLSLAIAQINLLVITIIASTLASGSLAVFNFANNLQSFAISIFGISFAIAAFPVLTSCAFDKKKLISQLSRTIRQILFFIIPATVLLLTLRAQIVRVILGSGQFDWQDTVLTINTLSFFCLSLFAQALIPLLTRAFYARYDSKTPFIIGLLVAIFNLFLSLWLAKKLGVSGLALAFSLANIINFILLWFILRLELGGLDQLKIFTSCLKFSFAALAAGAAIQLAKLLVWPFINMTKFWGVLTQGLVAGMAGIFIYLLVCWLLESEELFAFCTAIKRRLSWKKVQATDQGEARGI